MPLTITHSQKLFNEARKYMPAGVNSPVRAFRAVGGDPLFIESGRGPRVTDADGNHYIDYLASWGPLILGHAHPQVLERIKEALERGTTFGAPHRGEIRLAELVCSFFPSIEMLRLVNSGTEAAMSALRVARGFTGRKKVIKFEGCYHGHADALLAKAGSGAMTFGIPDSLGVPEEVTQHTVTLPYNDINSFNRIVEDSGREIAAVIVEPVAGNMGVVPPADGFLAAIRSATAKQGIVLIFDEVITGFRLARGGAQEKFGIIPDMTVLGKILGGGLPIGAYGGRREIMQCVAPLGGVYQAGTLSGNPVAVAAGIATLEIIASDECFYQTLEKKSEFLTRQIGAILSRKSIPHTINRAGSMFTIFFSDRTIIDYESAKSSNTEIYASFFRKALEGGLYFAPSQFECAFVSSVHGDEELNETLRIIETIDNIA
jgi:glutamate-1-semialdehyde 2,1-aminomutase